MIYFLVLDRTSRGLCLLCKLCQLKQNKCSVLALTRTSVRDMIFISKGMHETYLIRNSDFSSNKKLVHSNGVGAPHGRVKHILHKFIAETH